MESTSPWSIVSIIIIYLLSLKIVAFAMFKATDSIITNLSPAALHKTRPKRANLLDLLQNQQDDGINQDIQTFDQFREVLNQFDFQKNEQNTIRMFRNVDSMLRKPRYGIGKRVESEQDTRPGRQKKLSIDAGLGANSLEPTGGFLNVVQEELYSRGSIKRAQLQEKQSLNAGLDLTYTINESPQKRNRRQSLADNGSMFKSSAHSSRSYNGFDQINQYEIKEKIGSGAFSTVNLCIDVHTGQKYAMKVLQRKHFQKKLFRRNSMALADSYINNQIAILKKMEHPHIIKLYEVIEDEVKNKMFLILEYCPGGFINQVKTEVDIRTSGNLEYRRLLQSECKRYFKQISLAVDYMHNVVKIAHRDIKPENILLSEKDEAKIADFGLGTEDIEVSSKSGTRAYLPPEARNENLLNSANIKVTTQMADIWALGMTLIVMLNGRSVEIEDSLIQSYVGSIKEISTQCKDFILRCLKIDPSQRMKAAEMLDHPWVMAKKNITYQEFHVTKEQQQNAIKHRNRDILNEIAKLHLP